mgnify:CR=1 FL=1
MAVEALKGLPGGVFKEGEVPHGFAHLLFLSNLDQFTLLQGGFPFLAGHLHCAFAHTDLTFLRGVDTRAERSAPNAGGGCWHLHIE